LAGQIRLALLSVTLVAILVATIGALAVGSHYLLEQMRAHLRALASVTATHSEPALLFKDRNAAEEVLRHPRPRKASSSPSCTMHPAAGGARREGRRDAPAAAIRS
jgi:hypothetical protein